MRPDELALRYVGIRERPGAAFDPFIAAWIADAGGPSTLNDETPWCGAFVYHVAHRLLGLEPPVLPMRARSWLTVGVSVRTPGAPPDKGEFTRAAASPGDAVILSRGPLPQPGSYVLDAPGHVGFLLPDHFNGAQHGPDEILLVSGNQADAVTVAAFRIARVLGVRRLRPARG